MFHLNFRFSSVKNVFGKCVIYFMTLSTKLDEKIKTWTLRFPAKEKPNMEKALFDWPIVLQYDVKAKYRLISRKFSGHEVFVQPSAGSTNQKQRTFISVR